MMRPRGVLGAIEYDMFSKPAEGVGNAGVSADPAAPDGVGNEVPPGGGAAASEGVTLADVDVKTW